MGVIARRWTLIGVRNPSRSGTHVCVTVDDPPLDAGERVEVVDADAYRGAVSLSAEELHCLTCAMAGNFPERFQSIRMDLLRKLAKASRAVGGSR